MTTAWISRFAEDGSISTMLVLNGGELTDIGSKLLEYNEDSAVAALISRDTMTFLGASPRANDRKPLRSKSSRTLLNRVERDSDHSDMLYVWKDRTWWVATVSDSVCGRISSRHQLATVLHRINEYVVENVLLGR